MKLLLIDPVQGHQAFSTLWQIVRTRLADGRRQWVSVTEDSKTRPQEKKYHAMIGDIARQAAHLGSRWDDESWKRFLLDQFAHDTDRTPGTVAPSLDMTRVVQLGIQSRRFDVKDANDFIEWLFAWGAENGIEWSHESVRDIVEGRQ